MVSVQFSNPSYLYFLILVPLMIIFHIFTLKQNKIALVKFANFEAISRVTRSGALGAPYKGLLKNKNVGLVFLRALIYTLFILSAAGVTLWYETLSGGFTYVLALDSSSSMLANDFTPNRLEAAKTAAMLFVDTVGYQGALGLVTFANSALADVSITKDRAHLKTAIQNIALKQTGGTAVGDAIILAANMLEEPSAESSEPPVRSDGKQQKAIVLVTDGQSNVGVDTATALSYAKQKNIIIYTIGVATPEGGTVSNLPFVSKLDTETLTTLARETGGKFFVARSPEGFSAAFETIGATTKIQVPVSITWMLLVLGIALLGLEWILINTIYKTIP